MKKFTLALMALLAFSFSLKAQQYVSTEPANRNVIIEEFTGRGCGYCPDGHRIANQIMAANPGRVWAINIHAGGYAQTSYPNMITQDGNTIHNGFSITGYPCGVVNRTTAAAQDRGQWTNTTNTQLNQAAECNVAGSAIVNPDTRLATITVEVYYTGNSSADQNYLTVAMLQDSILGSQSDYGNYNPEQWLNGQYVHMHILRDVVNESAWGEAISPTTQGTLITRTYEYAIPETIGSPNGVNVDLDNIFFLAWVSERYQGTPTRPILTACKLEMLQGSDEPIYPMVSNVSIPVVTCSHEKDVEVDVRNIGTETITSMTVNVEVEGVTSTVNWEGELVQYGNEKVMVPIEIPFGTYAAHVTLTDVNGETNSFEGQGSVTCLEWADLEVEGDEETLKLLLMQDKFGNQITWEFTASDGTVLGSGGPYTMLVGGSSTQLHIENVTVPTDECVTFTIHDDGGNGICCANGQGYYIIKDSQGNVLVGDENDGDFGNEAKHQISVKGPQATVEVGETEVGNITYTSADFIAPLVYDGYPDEVGFVYRKVTSSTSTTVVGRLNEFRKILGSADDLEASNIYMVKAYATVDGETYYGPETTFQTWMEGVDELEQTVKMYPNPTSGVLNIVGEGMTTIEVYNTVGQRVMTLEVNGNSVQINTEGLNAGIYFVRVIAADGAMLNRSFSVVR